MNRFTLPGAIPALLLSVALSQAAELTQIDRKIGPQPAYRGEAKYCLLVFGRDAHSKIWLVHDGDTLYVDRNANGDITEPPEQVKVGDGDTFEVGDLQADNRAHTRLIVDVEKFQRLAEIDAEAKKRFAQDPNACHYLLSIDLELPGRVGRGIGGRVRHVVERDANGFLEFADAPEQAPVIHFDGRWEMMLLGRPLLTIGRSTDLVVGVGTPGLGAGTTAYVGYEGIVPQYLSPRADITFAPAGTGQPAIHKHYELKQRCLTVNFQDTVGVPDEAASSPATITLSFDAWKGGEIFPSRYEVDVVTRSAGPAPEPVSPRLKGKLVHPARKGTISVLAYSPDGKRIVAGDYPGGVVQVWDAESGKELVTIDTGYGYRSNAEYFSLSPDLGTLFAVRRGEVTRTDIEKDGKKLARWEFDGRVRAWDVATGKLRQTFQHSPPRGMGWMDLSPDGRSFITFDQLPGEVEMHPPDAASLWDAGTGRSRELGRDLVPVAAFTPDGQTVALQAQNDKRVVTAVKLFDVPTARERLSIPITEPDAQRIGWMLMSPDGRQLVAQVRDETKTGQHWLKFWDVATGEERASVKGETRAFFMGMVFSPDGQTLAVTTSSRESVNKLLVFDVATDEVRYVIDAPAKAALFRPAFSADGRWIAVRTQVFPDLARRDRAIEDFTQPHILLIDAATGEVRETIVSVPGLGGAVCFSPDGRTLASGGDGCVLLWHAATKE